MIEFSRRKDACVPLFAILLSLFMTFSVSHFAQAQEYVPGELIVKMKGRPSGSKSAAFLGKNSGKLALKATYGRLNMHHMSLKSGQSMEKALEELRNDPDVEYAEPNYILRKSDAEVAGADPRVFSIEDTEQMLADNNAFGTYVQSGADTKTTAAWSAISSSSSDVPIVAVIDTGVFYTHPVFVNSGAIWQNPGETGLDANGNSRATNGIDDDGNGYIDDVRGWNFYANSNAPLDDDDHGTHVAGIILGVTQDIFASPLQAANIRLMPLKFLGADGTGSTSSAVAAIYYAVNNGAQVINNSWGGGNYSQALHDALTYAYNQNVVLVAAAGNSGKNNDTNDMFPANYPVPSLLSVAATNDFDSLASFSNYGASKVHLAAPGVGIYSTARNNTYKYMSGTSMAAPFVAGLAALARREAPNLSGYQIRNLIVNSAAVISGLSTKVKSGARANSLDTVNNSKAQVSVQSSQPSYVAVVPPGTRLPSSSSSEEPAAKPGCGMVSTSMMRSYPDDLEKGGGSSPLGMILALTLLPLLVWQIVRMQAKVSGKNRRRFERFVMNSEIKVRVGDRELVAQMNTISMGGASFKADALLERGGLVTMQISSPDGHEQIQVEGRVVWNEANQSYGVQFDNARDSIRTRIQNWTKDLVKAS